jgi:PAS domain S-box-containing protein
MRDELHVVSDPLDEVLATTDAAFMAIDGAGRIVNWNAAAQRAFGWSRDELEGRTIVEALMPAWAREEYGPRFTCGDWPTDESHAEPIRAPILSRAGEERYVEVAPRTSGRGSGRFVHSFVRDVTDQVRAEIDARWLSDAINEASVALCTVDADAVVSSVNPVLERLLGAPASELVGRRLTDLVPANERQLIQGALARLKDGQITPSGTSKFVRPDGVVLDLLVNGGPILSPEGRFCGMCFVVTDVTAQMAIERENRRQLAALQQLSAQRSRRPERPSSLERALDPQVAVRLEAIDVLLAALDARDHYTSEHCRSVVDLSLGVAKLLDFDTQQLAAVEYVALLHDIGKLGIPDRILLKRGPLTQTEWELMREHPAIGERIVAEIGSLAHLAPAIRAEHERWDGRGYPDGLRGEAIPIVSRIGLACDAWDAMTTDRPYRNALAQEAALAELRANAGTQFDPNVVDALLDVLERQVISAA